MEVQISIKIYPHVRAKLLAVVALLCATGAIVLGQVAFPHMAPAIGCILLCGSFAYATWPRTHYTHSTPMLEDAATMLVVPASDPQPVPVKTNASPNPSKTRKPKAAAIRTNLQGVMA